MIITSTLWVRTLLEAISLMLYMYLVLKTRRAAFLILEIQSLLVIVVRFLSLELIANPYQDLMLTASGVTMLAFALSQILDDRQYKLLVKKCLGLIKIINDEKTQS